MGYAVEERSRRAEGQGDGAVGCEPAVRRRRLVVAFWRSIPGYVERLFSEATASKYCSVQALRRSVCDIVSRVITIGSSGACRFPTEFTRGQGNGTSLTSATVTPPSPVTFAVATPAGPNLYLSTVAISRSIHLEVLATYAIAMLDDFSIVTTSGIVLWRRSYAPVSTNVVNSLINDVFVEERQKSGSQEATVNPPYRKDKYTLKWTIAKDVGLVFVVGRSAHETRPRSIQIDSQDRQCTKVFFTSPGLTTFSAPRKRFSSSNTEPS